MKKKIKRLFLFTIILIIIFATIGSSVIYNFYFKSEEDIEQAPLKIGVMLPLTGPEAIDSDEVLDLAMDKVNKNDGINAHKIELVYKDTYEKEIHNLAQEFIDDPSIDIVIGPGTSSDVYEIAPMFIKNKKLLISPLSTAGEVFRAFKGEKYFWRTCQSDVAQIRTILHIISQRDVKRISIIYEDSIYGNTFYEWTGFFSMELGIEISNLVEFVPGTSDFSSVVNQALEGEPEYIICVAFSLDTAKIKRELDKKGSSTKLFLTDAGETPYLIKALGASAEGLEGTTPSADPSTGFVTAYEKELGHHPNNAAGPTYDAFLLAAYTLARSEYKHGEEGIEDSVKAIITGRGTKTGWDEQGMRDTIDLIFQGELPDITGASGPLEFDEEYGVDPLETFYAHWEVEAGAFKTMETISSDISSGAGRLLENASAYRTIGSMKYRELQKTPENTSSILKEREDLWAVLIATSMGWENYRHQSDALAIYDILKNNGIDDNRIILFLIDDIPNHEKNSMKGDVHYTIDGKNLREYAEIDYFSENVTTKTLENVLLGRKTTKTPTILETNETSNIFIYIVDHGGSGVIPFDNGGTLKDEKFGNIIESMYKNNRFRQMFIMIETCFSGSMADDINTPGVVILTSASETEPSFATNYDSRIGAWLADDCTYQVIITISENEDLSIEELYNTVYEQVAGSHVRLSNYNNFGNISTTSINEFIQA